MGFAYSYSCACFHRILMRFIHSHISLMYNNEKKFFLYVLREIFVGDVRTGSCSRIYVGTKMSREFVMSERRFNLKFTVGLRCFNNGLV